MNTAEFWRKCSSCKKSIAFNTNYYECSVSTCTGQRTGYVFCSVPCWEVHLPGAKHRNAGAIEKRSPTQSQYQAPATDVTVAAPKRIMVQASGVQPVASAKSSMSFEILVVVSKMKQFIKDVSDMNTAEDVNQILSDKVRYECEKAILQARADGRKTVMARDFKS